MGTITARSAKRPESKVNTTAAISGQADIDAWADKGWIDLRPANMQRWKERAARLLASKEQVYAEGSAEYDTAVFRGDTVDPGDIVGWIFANEYRGARRK